MKTLYQAVCVFGAAMLVHASTASAQVPAPATEKFYVNVNFGAQLADRTVNTTASKPIYDETATLTSSIPVSGGALFDVSAGYRVWGDVYAGIGVSTFSDTEVYAWSASVPDLLFPNRPAARQGTGSDLKRREVSVNPHVTYVRALTDKIDGAFGLGLSIVSLKQDLINSSGFNIAAGTQSVVVTPVTEEATATGIYVALDVIYNLAPRYGVGGFIRYAGGKADLASAPDQNVGGMQAGGGIRLRF